ncbi:MULTISPECIES: ABC transporter substrate-binding protein [unclassified Mesorhizobium]|uniref:ABC transporter substrate-binding protein n=1 Tax=unclassified Mesorhizobium TaxID=325217 RepID=UPI000FD96F7F|nr:MULTISPECIES: ABC transporter substrate-binding protein [unclassified Mesorhizobium]TGR47132.1 ABC transporter substrate-binding protein [bacterium M00.F.Ca.ET.199.01.1.1]TGU36584.1 ABC transporter substrate-binding protein [bacterium M00.F.Ca.ET.156.01.1.1]TGV87774.1 ABC transporter substrate-binding protein [Mesorhizobium sp. M00.F.Ca.ET.149.01.1.1]TGP89996.1 ABC transporter substrate-binding protein [Mesorhizobium sp. M8A.F.Ca.ET.218.01.1.1]TGR28847.1 ABC transporter substrate-binding pr
MKSTVLRTVLAPSLLVSSLLAWSVLLGGQAYAKTLVYCSEANPETFNPAIGIADSTMDAAAKTIFNRLVEFKAGTTEVGPALAESWDVSPDGKTYTFHLRHGVKFQSNEHFTPSRDFNADDVLYTFNRQRDADNPYHKLGGGAYEYFNALGMGTLIDKIDKVDDHTVRFTLTAPNVTFLAGLALDYLSILSLEQTQKMVAAGTPELIDSMPVGTGPFVLQAYVPDSQVRYAANKDYWRGAPKIDTLVFAVTPEPTTRVERIKANECQVAAPPPPSAVADLRGDPDITVLDLKGQNIGILGFNVDHQPLGDVRVRMALAKAIDRKAIVEAVYAGAGTVAGSVVPPAQLGAVTDAGIDYDPDGAKKLLKEAGHESGLKISLWAMPVSRPYNPNAKRMAEMIQADWAKVGVHSEIVSFEWGEYLKRTAAGEQDTFLLGGSSDNGDPDNMLSYLLSCDGVKGGSNRSRWCDKDFEKLLDEGRVAADPKERAAIYGKAQAILKAEVPVAPIAHSMVAIPIRKSVLNYVLDPFGRQNFAAVDMAE